MHFNCTGIIGDGQQTTCTCIQLDWELKRFWKIVQAVPWCCKRGWMHSLLQSMHCILFILHMLGLIHWLREVLLWMNIIRARNLKELQMNIVSHSRKFMWIVISLSFQYEFMMLYQHFYFNFFIRMKCAEAKKILIYYFYTLDILFFPIVIVFLKGYFLTDMLRDRVALFH